MYATWSLLTHAVLSLANTLLSHTGISQQVTTLKQCNSTLFSELYKVLTGSRVSLTQTSSSEEARCQAVVDDLSKHLSPHVSLEHIKVILRVHYYSTGEFDITTLDMYTLDAWYMYPGPDIHCTVRSSHAPTYTVLFVVGMTVQFIPTLKSNYMLL